LKDLTSRLEKFYDELNKFNLIQSDYFEPIETEEEKAEFSEAIQRILKFIVSQKLADISVVNPVVNLPNELDDDWEVVA
jgi:formiminotetrahydrofolate cyclodeaminase